MVLASGLSNVSEVVIGDSKQRGISGGQRKRVNVGMELIAEPRILFLDEPTSGLDSVSAVKVRHFHCQAKNDLVLFFSSNI